MSPYGAAVAGTSFSLPADLSATEPPEQRGLARDGVRLLVAEGDRITGTRFAEIGRFLRPGDVLVVNTSATRPAAVDARRSDRTAPLHLSTVLDDDSWVVEVRRGDPVDGPATDVVAAERLGLPGGRSLTILGSYPHAGQDASRLWRAALDRPVDVDAYLRRHGRPIRYGYVPRRWPLSAYQTVFATEPGSAEMPSAGRPFSDRLVTTLAAHGVGITPVVLHTGVSSPEPHEPPYPERYRVPAATARLVNAARAGGGRVVAVGTTAVRALETVAGWDGVVVPGEGWTDLVLGPDRPTRVVDGLVTGWHAPQSSHLLLLEAVAGRDMVQRAYDAALSEGYLWHEFGDSCLLLR